MGKGTGVLPKPLMAAVALVLIVFALIFLYLRLELLFTNPCWKNAVTSLEDIEKYKQISSKPELILDGKCTEKVVFTPSSGYCESVCKEYSGDDHVRSCVGKCQNTVARSFVVMMPKQRKGVFGYPKKFIDAIGNSNFYWLFDGKPIVFILDCEIDTMEIEDCEESGSSWVCEPGKEKTTYKLKVVETARETCSIKTG